MSRPERLFFTSFVRAGSSQFGHSQTWRAATTTTGAGAAASTATAITMIVIPNNYSTRIISALELSHVTGT